MFFSKAILVSAVVIAMSLQVSAHAIILPAVGVDGTAARKDVTRPKDNDPCAGADLSKLAAEKGIPVAADGTANPKIQNFNPKKDGSREVEMQLDITGTGNSFQKAGTVVVNGDAVPTDVKTQALKVQLPAGTTCDPTNGCLAAFKTDGGFGNCVKMTTGAAAGGAAGNATAAGAGAAAKNSPTGDAAGAGAAAKDSKGGGMSGSANNAAGSGAAAKDSTDKNGSGGDGNGTNGKSMGGSMGGAKRNYRVQRSRLARTYFNAISSLD